MRTAIVGILAGLTAAYPVLALLLWHTLAWTITAGAGGTAWVLQQPSGAAAVAGLLGWRYLKRWGRRTA